MSEITAQEWRDFSANTSVLEQQNAEIHSRYLNKWIGLYKGRIEAVADTFDGVETILSNKQIPFQDSLVRFIGQKEMTLIL